MVITCMLACPCLFSQAQISGFIHSVDGKPLSFVNLLLLATADSFLVKGGIAANIHPTGKCDAIGRRDGERGKPQL